MSLRVHSRQSREGVAISIYAQAILRSHKNYEKIVIARNVVTWQSLSMTNQYYVYIMSNSTNTVTYTGVTNDLYRRVYEHKNKLVKGFTKRYNINKLVYYEVCEDIESVILREKQIKSWSRRAKVDLIKGMNPEWRDLSDEFYEG